MEKDTSISSRFLLILAVLLALWAGPSCAQILNRTIHGIVLDENKSPPPAAHVKQVANTPGESIKAVITDLQGHFSLTLPARTKAIEVSFLGYESVRVELSDKSEYTIVLAPASELLDEVVVTGHHPKSPQPESTLGKDNNLQHRCGFCLIG